MISFDILTIFPEILDSYFRESLLQHAQKKRLIKIKVHNLRKWAKDRHKSVDDKPFGGGRGMVVKIEPVYKATQFLKSKIKNKKSKIILFSPRGKRFNQKMATQWSRLGQLIFICGRYEGVDERVAEHIADEVISIGDYVLMGGELPAMVAIETIARLISGVVGKSQLLKKERITKEKGFLEYPQYTRPEVFKGWKAAPKGRASPSFAWRVPKILLSGHHKKIEEWRKKNSKVILR